MLISENWAEALDPVVHHWFELGYGRRAPLLASLFNVQTSTKSDEKVGGIGAVGIEAWELYEQSGKTGKADFDKGYVTTYTHKEYPLEFDIQRKLYDDAQYAQITNIAQRVGDSAAVLYETKAAEVFNNAFDDTYAGADGVGLCSTAHPDSPQKTGSTQSNEGTYSLTADNIATVREAMMAFTDDVGNKMAVTPDLLLVPPTLYDDALTFVFSPGDPDSANLRLNPNQYENRFKVKPWHYLTDTNAWFMIDTSLMRLSLDWFNRVPFGVSLKNTDRTLVATWIAYARFSYGWADWRWIYGNNPS